ncbi:MULTISPECIES: mechanosensitive ion channel family protein [unclassified Haladaptatus]|uniref:mechanosensitive ion channel family protein n=1 Tax=unclassified Haladaptatus TaxID=2622732 RepID=UPI0023E7A97F|nr:MULTISPECIES: mechanosensitive ion channel family protein [unclassified Haladaptatus]
MAPEIPIFNELLGNTYGQYAAQIVFFIGAFLVVFLIGQVILTPIFERLVKRRGLDDHARKPLARVVAILIFFLALFAAFAAAGFGNLLTSLATIAAAATLAIGFAMQDVIKNFVAGIFIYTDKPFRIGDWIEWDSYSGIVEDISLRVSRVRTFDNELLTVPNSTLTDGVIKNPVAKSKLRLKFVFGIGYDDDIDLATKIIMEEAEKHEGIMANPEPSVRLTELADSYVGLQSRIWIDNPSRADFVKTRGEYVTNVKKRFDAEGIEIPYPQRDLSGTVMLQDGSDFGAVEH